MSKDWRGNTNSVFKIIGASNDDARYDNLILELGKLLKDMIDQTMDQEITNTVKVKMKITKVEDK